MNKAFFWLATALIFSLAVSGCKRPAVKSSGPKATGDLDKFAVQQIDFDYFQSKAKIHVDDGKSKIGFNAVVRMKKDSIIWMSISPALGIEVARVAITPDSVKIMDRLKNRYEEYSIDYFRDNFNVPLSFEHLQNMLIGNMLAPKTKTDRLSKHDSASLILDQNIPSLLIRNIVNRSNMKVTEMNIKDAFQGHELVVKYDGFTQLGDFLFPQKNAIKATFRSEEGQQQAMDITIEHNKPEFSEKPLNFAFNVPKKYESR